MSEEHETYVSGVYEKNVSGGYEKNISKSKNLWAEFFVDKRRGGHRYSAEKFLAWRQGKNYSIWMAAKYFLTLGAVLENSWFTTRQNMKKR